MGLVQTLRRANRRLYLCHNHADFDALASAYLLHAAAPGDIAVAGAVRTDTAGFCSRFGIQLRAVDQPSLDAFDGLVTVVDTDRWDRMRVRPRQFLLVDHRAEAAEEGQSLRRDAAQLFHAHMPSCSWLVYTQLKAARVPISRDMALAALCGFCQDDGLSRSSPAVLRTVVRTMEEHGLTLREAEAAMEPLSVPDPMPTLEVLQAGHVVSQNGVRLFLGRVTEVGQSFTIREVLMDWGFDAYLLKREVPGDEALLFGVNGPHRYSGAAERFRAALRVRYPQATLWVSGIAPPEPLDRAIDTCVRLLLESLAAGGVARGAD